MMSEKSLVAQDSLLDDWLLTHVGHEHFTPGFSRLHTFLAQAKEEIKTQGLTVITIAGTNGKGEVSHRLARLLGQAGKSYGLWTSPHILSVRERFVFDGEMIDCQGLEVEFDFIAEEMKLKSTRLSYFEFLLVVFIRLALKKKVEYLILEVGLGGRLDGVNYFDADWTAITSISRDHEEILGRGYKNILREKWGVSRSGSPMITSLELAYCRQWAKQWANSIMAWIDLFQEQVLSRDDSFSYRNCTLAYLIFLGLMEKKSSWSTQDLRMLAQEVHSQRSRVEELTYTSLPGRGERMTSSGRSFIFLGSHNLDGIRKLFYDGPPQIEDVEQVLFSLSKRDPKEVVHIVRAICEWNKTRPRGKEILLTEFNHPKAMRIKSLLHKELSKQYQEEKGTHKAGLIFLDDWKQYLKSEKTKGKNILVTGSYYFVGEVQKYILQGPF